MYYDINMSNETYQDEVIGYNIPDTEQYNAQAEYQDTLLSDPHLRDKLRNGTIQCLMGRLIEL